MKCFLLCFVVLLFAGLANGRGKILPLLHFDQFNGLPARVLYNIRTDQHGFIWLASSNGLFRFDGRTFYRYTTRDGLCDNEIIEIFPDSRGNIWCSGYNGKISVIRGGIVATDYDFIRDWHSKGMIYEITEDRSGNIYLAGEQRELFRIDTTGGVTHLSIPADIKRIRAIGSMGSKIWINGFRHIYQYDEQQGFREIFFPGIGRGHDSTFVSEQDGTLWALTKSGTLCNLNDGTSVGLHMLEGHKVLNLQVVKHFALITTEGNRHLLYDLYNKTGREVQLPEGTRIADITADNKEYIWISTLNNGLFRLDPKGSEKKIPVIPGNITGAYKEEDGLIALHNDFWITRLAGGKAMPLRIRYRPGRGRLADNCVFRKTKKQLLLLTNDGVCSIDSHTATFRTKNGGKEQEIYRDSLMLIRSFGAIIQKKLPPDSNYKVIFSGRSFAICLQGDTLWIGWQGGLCCYDMRTGSIKKNIFTIPDNGRIEYIHACAPGTLMLATSNNGIFIWQNGKVRRHITTDDGLFENDCKEIVSCVSGWVIRHPAGLSFIQRNGARIWEAARYGDIPLSAVNSVAAYKDTVLLSTTGGLFVTGLTSLFGEKKEDRRVELIRISSGGNMLSGQITLASGNNRLKIEYGIPEYEQPLLVQYAWSLNGAAWNKAYVNTLDMSDLQSGAYNLRLMARAPGYTWTSATVLSFTVKTPFWKKPVFILPALLCLFAVIWLYLRWYYHRQLLRDREKASVRLRLLSYEQKALNAMMNPHFVFNAMAGIQYLLNRGDTAQADHYLVKFSRLIRSTLDVTQAGTSTLKGETERLALYLQLEKIRLDEQMDFEITVDPDLDIAVVSLPTMILQTYVENAVVHGVGGASKVLFIRISFEHAGNSLLVRIADNGPGFPADHVSRRSTRFGLDATKKRLELLGQITGKSYQVRIDSPVTSAGGTCVQLIFPFV